MKRKETRNRALETRRFEERIAEEREDFDMEKHDALHIPPHLIPEDVVYHWARVATLGEPDTARMIQLRRDGWSVVPPDRHPDLVFEDLFGRKASGGIYYRDLLLVERPKEKHSKELRAKDAYNQKMMNSLQALQEFQKGPGLTTKVTHNPRAVTNNNPYAD